MIGKGKINYGILAFVIAAVICMALVGFISFGFEKKGTISGTVADEVTDMPVFGVTVIAIDTEGERYSSRDNTDTTGQDGFFKLELPVGTYTLEYNGESQGYELFESSKKYTVKWNNDTEIDGKVYIKRETVTDEQPTTQPDITPEQPPKTEPKQQDVYNGEASKKETAQQSIPSSVNIPQGAVVFQGHSYYIFDGNCNTWEEAQMYCKSRGGYLAVIESEAEDDFLFSYMIDSGRNEVYFGLSDANSEGDWRWVDNKTSSYQNWGINDDGEIEPNKDNEDEKYAEYDASLISGRWNDCGFGRDTSAYICEWDYAVQ